MRYVEIRKTGLEKGRYKCLQSFLDGRGFKLRLGAQFNIGRMRITKFNLGKNRFNLRTDFTCNIATGTQRIEMQLMLYW